MDLIFDLFLYLIATETIYERFLDNIEFLYLLLLSNHQTCLEGFPKKITAIKGLNFYSTVPLIHSLLESSYFKAFTNVRLNNHSCSNHSTFAIKSDSCLVAIHCADVLSILAASE